jgi:hypothetical protein
MSLCHPFWRRNSIVTLGLLAGALTVGGCSPVADSPTRRLADATADATADAAGDPSPAVEAPTVLAPAVQAPVPQSPDAAARSDASSSPSNDTPDVDSATDTLGDEPAAIVAADAARDLDGHPAEEGTADEPQATVETSNEDSLAAAIESTAGSDEDDDLPDEPFVPEPDTLGEEVLLVEAGGLKRLHPEYNVWIDAEGQRLVMAGQICRQEGLLEMFACLKGTKEHESVVSVYSQAFIVHAGLLALGAEPGHPVAFRPDYVAAQGPEVEVTVLWKDEKGELHEARGQDWVQNIKTEQPLDSPWVFGGSGFWKNELTGQENYMAEDGDFICVSNFPSAMLDLPVESSQAASDLLFQAYTERIPPVGTPVTMILTPLLTPADEGPRD